MKRLICVVWGCVVLSILLSSATVFAAKHSDARLVKKPAQKKVVETAPKRNKPVALLVQKPKPVVAPTRLKIRHAKPAMPLWQRILTNSYVMMVGYPFMFLLGVLVCGLYCRFPRRPNPVLQDTYCEEPEEKEGVFKKLFGKFRKTELAHEPA
jgi:hypothetical protein